MDNRKGDYDPNTGQMRPYMPNFRPGKLPGAGKGTPRPARPPASPGRKPTRPTARPGRVPQVSNPNPNARPPMTTLPVPPGGKQPDQVYGRPVPENMIELFRRMRERGGNR